MIGRRSFRYCCPPGGGGGGGGTVDCTSCLDAVAPAQWLVELSLSSGCTNCPSFDGSYLIDYVSACTWQTCFEIPTVSLCGLNVSALTIRVLVGFGLSGGIFQSFAQVRLTYGVACGSGAIGTDTFLWATGLTTAGELDCLAIDGQSIPYASSTGIATPPWCNGSVLLSAA